MTTAVATKFVTEIQARPCWAMYYPALSAMLEGAASAVPDRRAAVGGGKSSIKGVIAIVPIYGVIDQRPGWFAETSADELALTVRALARDASVGAIVLDIDSPGGSTFGVQEAADAIFAAREAKLVIAVANSMMASAAYWLGSAATSVYATPGALVGSIGVYAVHYDWSEAYAAAGIAPTIVQAGEHKAEWAAERPLTDSARQHIQDMVDDAYGRFVGAVARNRQVSKSDVTKNFGGGSIFVSTQAKAAGLIDGIATLDEVLANLAKRQKDAAGISRGRAKLALDAIR